MHRRAFTASLTAAVLAGPGDAVRASARGRPPASIAMLMFPGMTALDLVGPQAILAGLAGGRLHLVARQTGPIPSDTGLTMVADTSFETCPGEIDVLFVPGGDATPGQMREEATLAFLRDRAARASWVTSVCTGSLILGAAGLLDGYRATSHWCVRETMCGPGLGAIPVNRRVVVDRKPDHGGGYSRRPRLRSRPGGPSAQATMLRGRASLSPNMRRNRPSPPARPRLPGRISPLAPERFSRIWWMGLSRRQRATRRDEVRGAGPPTGRGHRLPRGRVILPELR